MHETKKITHISAEVLIAKVNEAIKSGWHVTWMQASGKGYTAILERDISEIERACYTCVHVEKQGYEPPCLTCENCNRWEELKG